MMIDAPGSAIEFDRARSHWTRRRWSLITFYWVLFALSILAFLLDFLIGETLPGIGGVLQVLGMVPCGLAWLFSRTLFQPRPTFEFWPPLVVAALFVSSLILFLDGTEAQSGVLGYIAQLQLLIGSAMLLLAGIEPLSSRAKQVGEQRFRRVFVLVYAALVATSFLFRLPELLAWQSAGFAALALVSLVGSTAAWRYRLDHPLQGPRRRQDNGPPSPLGLSIQTLLERDRVYLDPEVKVASLADRLGEPEYKVSQSIVNELGAPNFNQLINAYRLEAAKAMLARNDAAGRSILSVAMDCGFASLGPFNRAFKAQTGMTPSAFRRHSQAQ